jgi:hypothetical protein
MAYSITFGEAGNTRNTWSDWNLIPQSPPVILLPKPKTEYVEIPGRVTGPLDMSSVPFGHLTYDRIGGNFVFAMRDDYWYTPNPKDVNDAVRSFLHGKVTKMVLEDDPNHYFYGRFSVTQSLRIQTPFTIQIDYDLEPVRYNANGTIDTTWINT